MYGPPLSSQSNGMSSVTGRRPSPSAIVPMVLQNTNRCRSAFAAMSSTRRRQLTLVSNSGAGSRRWNRVSTTQ